MTARELLPSVVSVARGLDTRLDRMRRPARRSVVLDARTAMEYGMMAPVHRRLAADPRVSTFLMSSERPERTAEIFRDAGAVSPILSPRAAMARRFDACLAADFVWATLPRGTRRVQMFHGVAGKWRQVYDTPAHSMRQWDRLFFINNRRLQHYLACDAIDVDSPAIRLVGMPKSDCLVDGTLTRSQVLEQHGCDPHRPTVLYAPTWTRFSSLNAIGEDLLRRLIESGYRVLVKLHENSLDHASYVNSGGVDWLARLQPILDRGHGHLITTSDASPWLVAADVLITDHSSIGFEYLLLDRPLVRIHMPELVAGADIGAEYVELMASVSTTVADAAGALNAVDDCLADPVERSAARRALAAELFHRPGGATDRATRELYDLIELDLPEHSAAAALTV